MLSQTESIPRWINVVFCGLVLTVLLAACSPGGGTTTAPTLTPTAKAGPTLVAASSPAPTSPASLPTPTAPPAPGLVTYTGAGYTIGYPQGWKVTKGTNRLVTFADPQGVIYLAITVVPDPNGVVSAATEVIGGLQLFKSQSKNYQQANIASTTMLGGVTWSQGSATGTLMVQGRAVPAKIVVIADDRPAASPSTVAFTIAYAASQQGFAAASSMFFQPMLQSFKFS